MDTDKGLNIDMDMQHGNGHAPWTVTSSVDAGMLTKSFVRHHPIFVSLQHLFRHQHSGLVVSLVLLVMN
jgi:hypothetical protein